MMEPTLAYWNALANQFIFISALLAGFSLAVIVSLLNSTENSRVLTIIFKAAIISTASFLITIFAMTKMMMMTTEGFPIPMTSDDLIFPRLIGIFSFLLGILSLITIVSMAGRVKSKKMGVFTTIVGIITLIFLFSMMIQVSF